MSETLGMVSDTPRGLQERPTKITSPGSGVDTDPTKGTAVTVDNNDRSVVLLVRIVRASLIASLRKGARRMDSFAQVARVEDGEEGRSMIAKTPTAWGEGLEPAWDFTSLGEPYAQGVQNSLEFTVMEHRGMSQPLECGSITRPLAELIKGQPPVHTKLKIGLKFLSNLSSGKFVNHFSTASFVDHNKNLAAQQSSGFSILPLMKDGQQTGQILVQVTLVPASRAIAVANLTQVEPKLFEPRVANMLVSGGTASFYELNLRDATEKGGASNYYIGKDLSHTQDEVLFYESALQLQRKSEHLRSGLEALLRFMFEYLGILTKTHHVEGTAKEEKYEMLVLRNLFEGCKSLRMLDVKIGQKTALAGHHGKSKLKAFYRNVVDGWTNSGVEGFRLAGFNGPPPSFSTRDPLLDVRLESEQARRKALRIVFSKMPGALMFMYFGDCHQVPADPGTEAIGKVMTPIELMELVMHEVTRKLAALAVACRKVRVPQKWIGSSVAIAFDVGELPPRQCLAGEQVELRRKVRVHIFDWGRSDLNTVERHITLGEKEQLEHARFWRYYCDGVDRLAWEAARAYEHRFGNTANWERVRIQVFDFDSLSDDDKLCTAVEIPVEETHGQRTIPLQGHGGVFGNRSAQITYSMSLRQFPEGARMRESWRVTIHKGENLPIGDIVRQSSDPYVVLTAVSGGHHVFRQQGPVVTSSINPEWESTFDLPIAANSRGMETALNISEADLQQDWLEEVHLMLPPLDERAGSAWNSMTDEIALDRWRTRLDHSAGIPARRAMTRATAAGGGRSCCGIGPHAKPQRMVTF